MHMDSNVLQPRLTGDKAELLSHRLSDSDSESHSRNWMSQLSPISSQPSLAELRRSPTVLTAASLNSPDGSYGSRPCLAIQNSYQDRLCSQEASTIGPGASFSSSNVILAEINEVADQDSEGSLGSGSLKAESELLDPWESPFESSLPIMRCRKHGQSTSAFGAACEPLPWHDFPSGK